jgi:hypothetical protein
MATVTTGHDARSPDLDPRVSHPLDRLRGTIRRYVLVEGLLSAAIFVAAWFALGLALDFGLFKVATFDWVLDAPWWFRLVALVLALVLLAGIVTLRIVRRLTKELSYPALALVLERRFPKVLGDRLITAVELADVEGQSRYGYSREMIAQTIDEARERVGTVPVNDVFNWRRLRVLALTAAGLVAGVILVGFAAHAAATRTVDPYRFAWRMAHVGGTFVERNVFLQDTPWPRRAHLELVGFPGDELRIGKDAPNPVIQAKAFRWVVADRTAPMGWRPMTWGDVSEELIGGPVPALPVKGFRAADEGGVFAGDPDGWPLDRVERFGVNDAATRAKLGAALHPDEYIALQNGFDRVFRALEEKAADPSMGRRLRKLDVPEKVNLAYGGPSKSGDVTLSPQQNQEFAAPVSDLKESVQFVVRAEDFRTGPRTITLVPPPMFTRLVRTEYQPAYLHHAPPQDEGYPALRGLRQRMADRPLSLTGDRSVIPVPSGTELVLTATADTDLTAAYLQPKVGILPGAIPGSAALVPVPVGDDKRTVTVEFRGDYRFAASRTIDHVYVDADGWLTVEPVTTTPVVEFDLVVEQADGVRARRQILVQVQDDQPPVVEIAAEGIRKVGNVYYVTPRAKIPFNPESFIRDDHGLSKVAYEFTYWPEDSEIGRAMRAQLLARPFLYPPGPASVPGVVAPAYHAVKFRDLDKGDNRQNGSFGLSRYEEQKAELRRETRQVFEQRLAAPFEETAAVVVKKVELKSPDRDFFDVEVLKLLADVSEVQPRYRLDLNVVATDANYDTGPKTAQGAEPIRLLIVSEGDLLTEINKEEETFAVRLDEALAKLAGAKKKWEYVRNTNATGAAAGFDREAMDTARVRANDAAQDVAKARDVVQSVVREYRRIHRECAINVVTEVTRDKFGTFGNRIDRVLGENPPAVNDDERRSLAAGLLTPRMTFPVTEQRVEAVLAAFGENRWAEPAAVSDAEFALNVLELEVSAIRKALGELQNKEKLKKLLASVIESQKRIRRELEEWKIRSTANLIKKEPEIVPLGPVFLAKGETKRIKQGLNWRLFDKDDLKITVTASDPAGVSVAPELNLTFEQVELTSSFEYEIKGGNKEGEYTLTLTPEVGEPVKVAVAVK